MTTDEMSDNQKTSAPKPPFPDRLTVRRVANGWTVYAGPGGDEFEHVYVTPDELAKHVLTWAQRQMQ